MLKFQNFNGEHSKRTCIFPIINILSLKSTFKPFNIKYRYRGTETIVGNISQARCHLFIETLQTPAACIFRFDHIQFGIKY